MRETHGQLTPLPPGPPLDHIVLPAPARELIDAAMARSRHNQMELRRFGLNAWQSSGAPTVLLLVGESGSGKTLLARALATAHGLTAFRLNPTALRHVEPPNIGEMLDGAVHGDTMLLVEDVEQICQSNASAEQILAGLLDGVSSPVVLTSEGRIGLPGRLAHRITACINLALHDQEDFERLWEVHLPPDLPLADDVDLPLLAARYPLLGGQIRQAVVLAVLRAMQKNPLSPMVDMALLEAAAQAQRLLQVDGQALQWPVRQTLAQVALDAAQHKQVTELVLACRARPQLLGQSATDNRPLAGRGIVALFDGPPGTGKSLCATAVAAELGAPLARMQRTDAWGEPTVFVRAHRVGAVVLIDDAELWFGRRDTAVRGAEERQAVLAQQLLLQALETFSGVVLLTTSAVGSLDPGLLRRVQFRVTLAEPPAAQRADIFRNLLQHCPRAAPDVDFEELGARFELPGSRIQTAVLRASSAALAQGAPHVSMALLVEAASAEVAAAGKVVWAGAGQRRTRDGL